MNKKEEIIKAYDMAADEYGSAIWNGLEGKQFDQLLLNWFASLIPDDDTVLEIGAGIGEVSGYLTFQGIKCLGTDISKKIIENNKKYYPQVQFEVQDYFHLNYEDFSFGGVVGYYAIVNYMLEEVKPIFEEVKRVLRSNGIFLFTIYTHERDDKSSADSFLSKEARGLDFYYYNVNDVKNILENIGFHIVDILIRYPYKDIEFQCKRAYFIVKKP
jgi:ubiquinone/menaquinone biosynthesis C-methylase UbiE